MHELDDRGESIGRKIREAELRKIPRMLIVGERELQAGEASVREHGKGDTGSAPIVELTEALLRDIEKAMADDAVLWLTDRRGRRVGVPVAKVAFFNTLLPSVPLRGEGEYLVIGGDYQVVASYL